jgi:hypothetical protein
VRMPCSQHHAIQVCVPGSTRMAHQSADNIAQQKAMRTAVLHAHRAARSRQQAASPRFSAHNQRASGQQPQRPAMGIRTCQNIVDLDLSGLLLSLQLAVTFGLLMIRQQKPQVDHGSKGSEQSKPSHALQGHRAYLEVFTIGQYCAF